MASMEAISTTPRSALRWTLVTAVAPVAWGSTYLVTRQVLPADHPLWGGTLRALPAGLLLLLVARRLPRGAQWWRSLVLGTLTTGGFFALVYLSAQLLPTSVASTVMALSPVVLALAAWALLGQRPRPRAVAGAGLGLVGVALLLLTAVGGVDVRGVLASVAALGVSSVGYALATRWAAGTDVVASTAWQLLAGGATLGVAAVLVEGAPPALDGPAVLGFVWLSVVGTAVAFVAWFSGLRHLRADAVGLVGLLNPVTGVLLGTLLAGEALSARQGLGLVLVLLGVAVGQRVSPSPAARAARGSAPRRAPRSARAGRAHAAPSGRHP
ncbi:DMT family transporter [Cellulomonas endophytica]|uniref:DMT family transporter n=1 Tax=Cellulomonas endophytica TaxID=2494735 RepID=UPI0010122E81|nr:DMT family transporter [Cellulomonas endophytica]